MGQITSLFVRKVAGIVEDHIDQDELLRSVKVNPDDPVDPKLMVPDGEYYDFLERIVKQENKGTTLPLRAGASMRCDNYGALGLAWKSAMDLKGSYERAVRYARVLTSVSTYTVEETKEGAYMHLHRDGVRRLGMRLSNEATIASIATISQEASTEKFTPLAIFFKHSAPENISDHEEFFGCPVHYDTDRDALLISKETLETPNRLGDDTISKFFDSHLETEVSNLEETLDHQVRIQISKALSEGVPMISDVARSLHMSGRTLQRRLSEIGYSYQNMVDESRRDLAEKLLKQTHYSLADIAFMTGFSEQSAFNRSFKRWSGQTPRSYRLKFEA